jgi:hypothetical protein
VVKTRIVDLNNSENNLSKTQEVSLRYQINTFEDIYISIHIIGDLNLEYR